MMTITTFMALIGGIPTIISVTCFLVAAIYLTKRKTISFKELRIARKHSKLANINYYLIKEKIKVAPFITRLLFRMLVGNKRYKDYNYNG